MKSYTDLEQSKKLAEILPLESADLWWDTNEFEPRLHKHYHQYLGITINPIPCWSLAALFKLLPKSIEGAEPSLIKTFRDDYRIVYDIYGDENITSEDYTNPIDACYEMIIRLKEKDLL